MTAKLKTRRLARLAGLFGALLFLCGDMLCYGNFGAGATFHITQGLQRGVLYFFFYKSPDKISREVVLRKPGYRSGTWTSSV